MRSPYISPHDLISELSLEGLNRTSNEYFEKLPTPLMQMGKPFTMPANLPHTLEGLAMICRGLHLTPSMSVVDFGAGTCWLSRYLAQMGCNPIAVDVSQAALDLGKRLFAEYPICGHRVGHPQFLAYDGRTIDLPDDSVDRIICFDSFHHVPNPEEVLAEFYRILRPSGLIGFHEPGLGHSRTLESQMEMRDFKVLENDVDKREIFAAWQRLGPGEFRTLFRAGLDFEFDDSAYEALYTDPEKAQQILQQLLEVNRVSNVFSLSKGPYLCDSRVPEGLVSKLELLDLPSNASEGATISVDIVVSNVGTNRWLTSGSEDYGVVGLGGHLLSEAGEVLDYDFLRFALPRELLPGEMCGIPVSFSAPPPGRYELEFDMVSGHVCWFSQNGSKTKRLSFAVQ